jgi:hypothetical protein
MWKNNAVFRSSLEYGVGAHGYGAAALFEKAGMLYQLAELADEINGITQNAANSAQPLRRFGQIFLSVSP